MHDIDETIFPAIVLKLTGAYSRSVEYRKTNASLFV